MNNKELDALNDKYPALSSLYSAMCHYTADDNGDAVDATIWRDFEKYENGVLDTSYAIKYMFDAFIIIVEKAGYTKADAKELLSLYCFD